MAQTFLIFFSPKSFNESAILKNDSFVFQYESTWEKRLSGTVVDSSSMISEFSSIIEFMKTQKTQFLEAHDSGHSSYSDYSETETDSDDQDDEYTKKHKKQNLSIPSK